MSSQKHIARNWWSISRFLYSCLLGQSMALGSWVWLVQSFKSKHIFHFRLTFILKLFFFSNALYAFFFSNALYASILFW